MGLESAMLEHDAVMPAAVLAPVEMAPVSEAAPPANEALRMAEPATAQESEPPVAIDMDSAVAKLQQEGGVEAHIKQGGVCPFLGAAATRRFVENMAKPDRGPTIAEIMAAQRAEKAANTTVTVATPKKQAAPAPKSAPVPAPELPVPARAVEMQTPVKASMPETPPIITVAEQHKPAPAPLLERVVGVGAPVERIAVVPSPYEQPQIPVPPVKPVAEIVAAVPAPDTLPAVHTAESPPLIRPLEVVSIPEDIMNHVETRDVEVKPTLPLPAKPPLKQTAEVVPLVDRLPPESTKGRAMSNVVENTSISKAVLPLFEPAVRFAEQMPFLVEAPDAAEAEQEPIDSAAFMPDTERVFEPLPVISPQLEIVEAIPLPPAVRSPQVIAFESIIADWLQSAETPQPSQPEPLQPILVAETVPKTEATEAPVIVEVAPLPATPEALVKTKIVEALEAITQVVAEIRQLQTYGLEAVPTKISTEKLEALCEELFIALGIRPDAETIRIAARDILSLPALPGEVTVQTSGSAPASTEGTHEYKTTLAASLFSHFAQAVQRRARQIDSASRYMVAHISGPFHYQLADATA